MGWWNEFTAAALDRMSYVGDLLGIAKDIVDGNIRSTETGGIEKLGSTEIDEEGAIATGLPPGAKVGWSISIDPKGISIKSTLNGTPLGTSSSDWGDIFGTNNDEDISNTAQTANLSANENAPTDISGEDTAPTPGTTDHDSNDGGQFDGMANNTGYGGHQDFDGQNAGSSSGWGNSDCDSECEPIVIDLDGDGIDLVDLSESTAFYDINDNRYRNNVGWSVHGSLSAPLFFSRLAG